MPHARWLADGHPARRLGPTLAAVVLVGAILALIAHQAPSDASPGRVSFYSPGDRPAAASTSDPDSVTLGVHFFVKEAGTLDGIRFYKGPGNVGPHPTALWSKSGQLLATATPASETATGWQTATFPSPVALTPWVDYIASYLAPHGHYPDTEGTFSHHGWNSGVIRFMGPRGAHSGNGVYDYGHTLSFPSSSWEGSNYWIDVIFSPGSTTPPTTGSTTTTLPSTTTTTTVPSTTTTTVPSTTTTTAPGGGGGYHPPGPSNMTSCAGLDQSPTCDWPGPSNTGVPAGTVLTRLTAKNVPEPAGCDRNTLADQELTIDCANTVLDSYDIVNTNVFVSAANVTFSRDYFDDHILTNSPGMQTITVDYTNPKAHLLVEDTTANCYGWQGDCYHIIGFSQYKLLRVNFYGATDAIAYDNGDTVIEDSWLHGAYACLAYQHPKSPDEECGVHADVVQKSEGSNDVLIHNWIDSDIPSADSAMMCCTDQGPVRDLVIEDNLFSGPGYELYSGAPGQHTETGLLVENNHFMRAPDGEYTCCGNGNMDMFGPYTGTDGNTGIAFTGDIWDNNGQPIQG